MILGLNLKLGKKRRGLVYHNSQRKTSTYYIFFVVGCEYIVWLFSLLNFVIVMARSCKMEERWIFHFLLISITSFKHPVWENWEKVMYTYIYIITFNFQFQEKQFILNKYQSLPKMFSHNLSLTFYWQILVIYCIKLSVFECNSPYHIWRFYTVYTLHYKAIPDEYVI